MVHPSRLLTHLRGSRYTTRRNAVSTSVVTRIVMPGYAGAMWSSATLDDNARPTPVFGSATTAELANPRREELSRTEASRCPGSAGKKARLQGSAASLRECEASGRMAAVGSAVPQPAEVAGDR